MRSHPERQPHMTWVSRAIISMTEPSQEPSEEPSMSILEVRKVRPSKQKELAEGHTAHRRRRIKAFLPAYLLYFPSHPCSRQEAFGCE